MEFQSYEVGDSQGVGGWLRTLKSSFASFCRKTYSLCILNKSKSFVLTQWCLEIILGLLKWFIWAVTQN